MPPPHIDLKPDDPKVKIGMGGIYELGEGTLRIAGDDEGKKRPTEFKSGEGGAPFLVILTREKSDEKKDDKKKDEKPEKKSTATKAGAVRS